MEEKKIYKRSRKNNIQNNGIKIVLTKRKEKEAQIFFGCGALSHFFCPVVYKITKGGETKLFTVHIFTLRLFCRGEKDNRSDTLPRFYTIK